MGWRRLGTKHWLGLVGAAVLLASCGGVSRNNHHTGPGAGGEAGTSATGTGGGEGGEGTVVECKPDAAFAKARVWRLTDSQYVNAVRQLFGVTVGPEITEPDEGHEISSVSESAVVTEVTALRYRDAAQQVATQAVESHYESFMPCGDDDACADQLVRNRIARAFGRRLDDKEVARYLKLFRYGAERSPRDGVRLLIEATLQSPAFLYRSELGPPTPDGPKLQVTLTPYEVATLLALSFTNALPDDELWEKADTGALADPEVLADQVARLLDLDATHEHWTTLGSAWLGIEQLKDVSEAAPHFPEAPEDLRTSLRESGRLFARDVMNGGIVSDVVTSRTVYLNAALAQLYGVPGVTGAQLRAVEVDAPARGAGILSQPALLAGYSHTEQNDVVSRGLFAYRALACGQFLPSPPPTVDEQNQPEGDQRELATFRAQEPVCAGCHRGFDPLGLLSQRYDGIGRYREADEAGPIDQSAVLQGLGDDLDGSTEGLAGLSEKLQQGRRLSDCAAQNLADLTLGRAGIAEEGSCAFEEVKEALLSSGKPRDFFQAFATSPAFIQRDPE